MPHGSLDQGGFPSLVARPHELIWKVITIIVGEVCICPESKLVVGLFNLIIGITANQIPLGVSIRLWSCFPCAPISDRMSLSVFLGELLFTSRYDVLTSLRNPDISAALEND